MSRVPWWGWALVAIAASLVLLVAIPPLRDLVVAGIASVFATAVGVKATKRVGQARSNATEAVEEHRDNVAAESLQVEKREERDEDRASEALAEDTKADEPEGDEERRERMEALGKDPLS